MYSAPNHKSHFEDRQNISPDRQNYYFAQCDAAKPSGLVKIRTLKVVQN